MKRMGRRNRPFFRIVAIEASRRRDGREIEGLGTYDPLVADDEKQVVLNRERVRHWLSCGAQPSETVASILKRLDIKA